MAGDEGKTGLVILLEVWCFLPLRGGQEEELDALRFLQVFFSLKLLIGHVSYSQKCLTMRKKELLFVHIRDF